MRVHDFAPGSWWATTPLTFTRRSYECGVGYNPNVHIVRSQSRQLDTPPVSHPEYPPDSNENPTPTLGITLPRYSPTTTPGDTLVLQTRDLHTRAPQASSPQASSPKLVFMHNSLPLNSAHIKANDLRWMAWNFCNTCCYGHGNGWPITALPSHAWPSC
ncbi:hypothetical protein CORAM0001_0696 [Corynebacterium amycolatum SK46]|nr:hypothetical protein CORAM0001_0696 [Corynebacterium amycolatum SK46]